jgi:hypothetical protein
LLGGEETASPASEHCLTCGAPIPPWWHDCYCRRCLPQVYTALVERLLAGFLERQRTERRERMRRANRTIWREERPAAEAS